MINETRLSNVLAKTEKYIPNGVSSPMRSFSLVGGKPIVASKAKGSKIYDEFNRGYVDFLSAFGANYLGHAREEIVSAVAEQVKRGLVYGLSSEVEGELAEMIVNSTPAIDQIRFVCSGSEAVMTAVRIARAYTERSLVLKFVGSYHGHVDAMLALPESQNGFKVKGATKGITEKDVIVCEYNDIDQLNEIFSQYGSKIAAVIVEPVATNMGLVKPVQHFHTTIRQLCTNHGALFIFDEVVTGFRFRFGGVSAQFNVDPDLTTFGKIIGGGAPIGAYAGKRKFMEMVEIGNQVFQSGTFAANPLSMTAGKAALSLLADKDFYANMERKAVHLENEIHRAFAQYSIPYHFSRYGALAGIAFKDSALDMKNYQDVKQQDYDTYRQVHLAMRERGFLMAPSLEEPIFLTDAHSYDEISEFSENLAQSIQQVLGRDIKKASGE